MQRRPETSHAWLRKCAIDAAPRLKLDRAGIGQHDEKHAKAQPS
jgi:hypothetical protein